MKAKKRRKVITSTVFFFYLIFYGISMPLTRKAESWLRSMAITEQQYVLGFTHN